MPFIVSALIFVGAFGLIALIAAWSKKVRQAWEQAAERLGLRYERGSLFKSGSLRGQVDGFSVVVDTFTRGSGQHSSTYTRYRVRYPSLELGLELSRQGALSGVAKFFGAQDIDVGQASFDRNVTVKGRRPAEVRDFLTPERRVRVQRALSADSSCKIDDTQIQCVRSGTESQTERIVSTVRKLTRLAHALARNEASSLEQTLAAQSEGQLELALQLAQTDSRASGEAPGDADLDLRVVEGELLYTAGRYEDAAQVLEEVEAELPDDQEVKELLQQSRVAGRSTPPPLPAPEPTPEPERAPEPSPAAAPSEPASTLLSPTPLGPTPTEVAEIFATASELSADERDAYLARACDGNAPLRAQVRGAARGRRGVGGVLHRTGGPRRRQRRPATRHRRGPAHRPLPPARAD